MGNPWHHRGTPHDRAAHPPAPTPKATQMPSTQTTTDTQRQRADAYRRVLKDHGIDLTADYTGAEDAAEWLDGREIGRFAVITQAERFTYATPSAETLEEATRAAVEHSTDSLFAEGPVAVIDLDTGEEHRPAWDRLPWERVEK